jgi:mannose-6-phosphate isomerase
MTARQATVARVEKPWGYEVHWARTDRYVGKILHIRKGHALSLQYHERKEETIYVQAGRLRYEIGESTETLEVLELGPGDAVHVRPGLVHRMTALEDTDVLEASTPELDDVVRLDDRYGRTGTSAP